MQIKRAIDNWETWVTLVEQACFHAFLRANPYEIEQFNISFVITENLVKKYSVLCFRTRTFLNDTRTQRRNIAIQHKSLMKVSYNRFCVIFVETSNIVRDHPFKTSACSRGEGVKNLPNLPNLPTDSTKKLPTVGG